MMEKTVLNGPRIRLEPLSQRHIPGLAGAIADGALCELALTLVPHPDELGEFVRHAEAQRQAGLELGFATIDQASGQVVGSTRFLRIEARHRRAEIGFTFIAASWQRTYVNTEAKYLMLRHAFEQWQLNRVEFITDVLNEGSRAAILRLGAKEEGILRSHMVMRQGRVRDSVMYSITAGEWPQLGARLEAKMAAACPQ